MPKICHVKSVQLYLLRKTFALYCMILCVYISISYHIICTSYHTKSTFNEYSILTVHNLYFMRLLTETFKLLSPNVPINVRSGLNTLV